MFEFLNSSVSQTFAERYLDQDKAVILLRTFFLSLSLSCLTYQFMIQLKSLVICTKIQQSFFLACHMSRLHVTVQIYSQLQLHMKHYHHPIGWHAHVRDKQTGKNCDFTNLLTKCNAFCLQSRPKVIMSLENLLG